MLGSSRGSSGIPIALAETPNQILDVSVIELDVGFFLDAGRLIVVIISRPFIRSHHNLEVLPRRMPFSLRAAVSKRSNLWWTVIPLHQVGKDIEELHD